MTLLVVAVGGALGAVSRYVTTGWVQDLSGDFFPWGTLAVNVLGSLALGFALVWLQASVASAEARQFVAIGFLGSFTTFSTFSYESVALLRDGDWWRAGGYVAGSVLICLAAVLLGMGAANALLRR
jgi:CrcB protein